MNQIKDVWHYSLIIILLEAKLVNLNNSSGFRTQFLVPSPKIKFSFSNLVYHIGLLCENPYFLMGKIVF